MLVACGCVIMLFVVHVLVAHRTDVTAQNEDMQQQAQSASYTQRGQR